MLNVNVVALEEQIIIWDFYFLIVVLTLFLIAWKDTQVLFDFALDAFFFLLCFSQTRTFLDQG